MASNPFLRRIRCGHACLVAAALASLLLVVPVDAALLDWSAAPGNTWVAGSLTSQFNVDGVPGNDIQVTVTTTPTNTFTNGLGTIAPFAGTNANIGSGASGLLFGSSGLGPTNTTKVTVTITFLGTYATQGAYANFTLYDVDKTTGQYEDQISAITAQKLGGGTIGLNESVGSEVTLANGGTITATATGTAGISDHTGDVSISSGTNKVTSITFTWSNPNTDVGQQYIGLSNISFSSTPEVGSGIGALVFCGLLVGCSRWRGLARA
jgi:hypothetical protein